MSDRGAFIGADFEQAYNAILADITQMGLAMSQITAERKIRIMGALAGAGTGNREKNLNIAAAVYNAGEMFRNSHYMDAFVKANLLMMRFIRNRNFAKLAKFKGQLVHFYGTYETLTTIMEGALQRFDLYFDQWHTLTTMGLRPPERREGEMTYLAADETALEAAMQEQQRAREAWRAEIPQSIDDFATAFKKARTIAEGFDKLGIEDIPPPPPEPDAEEISKRFKDLIKDMPPDEERSSMIKVLTEMLASLKEDDKTEAGDKTDAGG